MLVSEQKLSEGRRKTLVISAVNLVEGGPLKVLKDCVEVAAEELPGWRIVVLAHRRELITNSKVEVIEMPRVKASWLRRLRAEWQGFLALSRSLDVDVWLALHDITPRVVARRQFVYCHNSAPFWHPTWRDAWFGPDYWMFATFYGLVYRPFMKRNNAVIVQQEWVREQIQRRYGASQVIVAHPELPQRQQGPSKARSYLNHESKAPVFFYPSLPRCFKNFEVIGEAVLYLESSPGWCGEVRWTISGDENRYTRWLKRRYGHLRSIKWLGLLNSSSLHAEYRASDCLIFPSRLETWGLPISEAKDYDLPILAANLPYAHETVGNYHSADFFDPLSGRDLAERMLKLASGHATTHPVVAKTVDAPYVTDWTRLVRLLTAGL